MSDVRGIDDWKCNAPDPGSAGGGENPDKRADALFWEGFKFAQRHGTTAAYLASYRDSRRFLSLVHRAERIQAHPTGCDCQICTSTAHRGDAA